jgi:hypothetical protein
MLPHRKEIQLFLGFHLFKVNCKAKLFVARHEVVASGHKLMRREADAKFPRTSRKFRKRVAEAIRSTEEVC